ncbi:MAG: hypothetical protein G8237_04915 [Magnetococcales bacterium]|nr:hypothetical protein [Magnetococcales bacterium]NGZ05677.1 hypothetical protein [Magnetococcales bacterium]
MTTFRVLSPLRHDGVIWPPGAIVEIDLERATAALASGALARHIPDNAPPICKTSRKRRSHTHELCHD